MAKKKITKTENCCGFDMKESRIRKSCGGTYFLGVIGSLVYYLSTATGFWNGVLGILKSLVWPAFLVFEALKFFGA